MANGVYSNAELLDSILVDFNDSVKQLLNGQFIQFCVDVTQISKKLLSLREGMKADLESKNKVIEQLKEQLREAGANVEDMPPEEFIEKYGKKDGANNGGN